MRRTLNTEKRRAIEKYLRTCSAKKLEWLERLGPEYVWILRHMYGVLGTTIEELSRLSGWTYHVLNPRRDEALYLLGFQGYISDQAKRSVQLRLEEFRIRQKLNYLLQYYVLSPADTEVIELALRYGARACDVAANSDWTLQTAFHALGRLSQSDVLVIDRPGERVRQRAMKELLAQKRNPKAELELEILSNLDEDYAVVDLAEDWGAEPTLLSALVAEVRRELSIHPATRNAFAKVNVKKSAQGAPRGSLAIRSLNAKLLPIYTTFRRITRPYSKSERKYLELRARGVSITAAGKQVMGVNPWRAAAIDRAFLGKLIPEEPIQFPKHMPLPPFTNDQLELMNRLHYVRISS